MAAVQLAGASGRGGVRDGESGQVGCAGGAWGWTRRGSRRRAILEFRERFLEVTGGQGVDVVLDSLAGEFVDASLGLLGGGGRFVEMGKTDIREPVEVASEHAGVVYRAFDLMDAGPERIREMLAGLLDLFERGVLELAPVRCLGCAARTGGVAVHEAGASYRQDRVERCRRPIRSGRARC